MFFTDQIRAIYGARGLGPHHLGQLWGGLVFPKRGLCDRGGRCHRLRYQTACSYPYLPEVHSGKKDCCWRTLAGRGIC